MIVKSHEADRYVASPPKGLTLALVYGPDAGLVQERAEKLLKSVVPDLTDAFNVSDLSETTLLADPARLSDEAAAISMMGGRRVVRVRGAGNDLADLLESFADDPKGDALVVIEAGDLAKTSALRKIFDGHKTAAAVQCYPDSVRDLGDVVRDALRAEGISIAPDALEDAVSRLGSDRGVTRREIEKLLLYMHGKKQVALEDVRAVMGDEAEARSESACDAAAGGDLAKLDRELERLWVSDVAPAQVLRSAMGHFQRLVQAREGANRGEAIDNVMKRLRPPVHFSRSQAFKNQAQRWNSDKLGEALDMLLDAEALTRTTGVPAEAVTGRVLMNIAAMAKGRM
ncbi:MAG: DNA polymerase III subunit delta [Alphaproteobacteria bacterium]|nr:DNA polymerase III subunit delta [Alphaproteobacteria bacterium]